MTAPAAAVGSTAAGLPKTYDPVGTESRWQEAWERSGAFHPDPAGEGEPFSVVIPPPNVTGSLHMGHAFNTALIDTIVRFQRLRGRNVLCLPGTDHASIAVQTILEKQLKAEGQRKEDLGREAFLEKAWAWKAESGGTIVGQLRRLGYSVDWQRERFTLDAGCSAAVIEAFNRLHEQGLIYRGEYLVNWCPASGSAVSDLEVEMQEVDGHLWHFRYPLTAGPAAGGPAAGGRTHLEVATTRPETLLGDTAVAVNPRDPRYAELVGQTLTLPLVGRQIPIVADDHVDADFGTGCVKVTPAHDPNDFAIGQRHALPLITVMAKDGSMNEAAGRFAGLDRFEARKAVVAAMEAEGFLVKVEPYRHSVPFSDRGKVPVEPLLSTQWFVRTEPLAARCRQALDVAAAGPQPRFVPERWAKVYRDWLTDIRDWCISRQLWWGHRIPAWFVVSETGGEITDNTPYVVARDEAEARARAEAEFGGGTHAHPVVIEQDPDALDTWFSSGLWPFSTLGWPGELGGAGAAEVEPPDLARWYPTSVLVTGFDIIFFWVARMTMMAGAFMQEGGQPVGGRDSWMPFRDVYIHGLVRDENNRKMSKSAGNGIDPLLLIERYGADALRFALVREVAGAGQDIRLDYDRKSDTSATVEAARNFANKLWNATRFALLNLGGETPASLGEPDPTLLEQEGRPLQLADRWILSRLARVNRETAARYESYGLGEAAKGLYEFAWNEVCDWYVELIKRRLQVPAELEGAPRDAALADQRTARQVLAKVLQELLVMLHPLMPHLSEELWHGLTGEPEAAFLALQSWPPLDDAALNDALEESFAELIEAIRVVRNLRAVAGLKPAQSAPVQFITGRGELAELLQQATADITALTRAESVAVLDPAEAEAIRTAARAQRALAGVCGELQVLLPIEGLVDLDALRGRLEKDIAKAEKEIRSLAGRLANPNFAGKAPPEVVAECQANLAEAEAQAELARRRLADLG
ncbi:MAG: valine--tRNA ligase [Cyanobacteriota bacterium]|nr:valine--tRNA ligase [Cyanobacteriota bacterium]